MIPEKQNMLMEQAISAIGKIIKLTHSCAVHADHKDSKIPSDDIDEAINEMFVYIIRMYKHDHAGILEKYHSSEIWKQAIRKSFLMDDEDEGGYWFYHAFQSEPNVLFELYLKEHPSIAFEKILEMFEYGRRKEFLELDFQIKEILEPDMVSHAIDELMNIINDRISEYRLANKKETAQFIAWMYPLDVRKIESFLVSFEANENKGSQEIARICRETLENEAKEQLKLEIQ